MSSLQNFSTAQSLKVDTEVKEKDWNPFRSQLFSFLFCSPYQGHEQKDFTEGNKEHLAERWIQMGWTVEKRTGNDSSILVSKIEERVLCFK